MILKPGDTLYAVTKDGHFTGNVYESLGEAKDVKARLDATCTEPDGVPRPGLREIVELRVVARAAIDFTTPEAA